MSRSPHQGLSVSHCANPVPGPQQVLNKGLLDQLTSICPRDSPSALLRMTLALTEWPLLAKHSAYLIPFPESHWPRVGKLQPWVKPSPLPVFVNKILLAHSYVNPLTCFLWQLPCCNGRVQCSQQKPACKAGRTCHLYRSQPCSAIRWGL